MVSSQALSPFGVKAAEGSYWFELDGLYLPRAVAGHPALDFVNTWAGWAEVAATAPDPADAHGGDFLKTYDHLALWASVSGVLEAGAATALRRRAAARRAEADAVLQEARRFRTALHELVLDPADARALREVNRVVRRAGAQVELAPRRGTGPRWSVGGGLERPLLAVGWAAAELLTQADLTTVGACPGDGCGWVFLDPRGRRRWCSMQWCGNRAKVRAHAERHRR